MNTLSAITGVSQPSGLAVGSDGTLDVASSLGSVVQFAGLGSEGVPGAPTNVTATPGDGRMTVDFSAPASDGGLPITGYAVIGTDITTPTNPVVSQSVQAGPVTIVGLVNGDFYSFTVAATNLLGTGPAASARPRAPGLLPGTPTASVTKVGSGTATVSISPQVPATAPPVLFYTVTAHNLTDDYSSGQSVTSVKTKVEIPGLLNGDAYAFTVTASNEVGTGPSSPATAAVVLGAPGKPRTVKTTAGVGQATVSFRAPTSIGAAPILSYTVTAIDVTDAERGGQTATGPGSPLTVPGLTHGDSYSFSVTATNADGTGPPEAPSKQTRV